jgi:hypothetical protein
MQNLYTSSGLDIDNARNIALTTPNRNDTGFYFLNEKRRIIIEASQGINHLHKIKNK